MIFYITSINRINTAGCPTDFRAAYGDLAETGQSILLRQGWRTARMAFFSPVDRLSAPDELSEDQQHAIRKWVGCRDLVAQIAKSYDIYADADVWLGARTIH